MMNLKIIVWIMSDVLFLTNVLTWNIQIPIKFLQNYNILNMRFFLI